MKDNNNLQFPLVPIKHGGVPNQDDIPNQGVFTDQNVPGQNIVPDQNVLAGQDAFLNSDVSLGQGNVPDQDSISSQGVFIDEDIMLNKDDIPNEDEIPNQDDIFTLDNLPDQDVVFNSNVVPDQDIVPNQNVPGLNVVPEEGIVPNQGIVPGFPNLDVFPGPDDFPGQDIFPGQALGPAPIGEQGQHLPEGMNRITQDADFIPKGEIKRRLFARQLQRFYASGLDKKNRHLITPTDIQLAQAMEPNTGPMFFHDGTNWPADWMVEEGNGVTKEVADAKALEFQQGLIDHRMFALFLFQNPATSVDLNAVPGQRP
ncbi:hypothetical protein ACHAP8_011764 [Fusarium lateritium]